MPEAIALLTGGLLAFLFSDAPHPRRLRRRVRQAVRAVFGGDRP